MSSLSNKHGHWVTVQRELLLRSRSRCSTCLLKKLLYASGTGICDMRQYSVSGISVFGII